MALLGALLDRSRDLLTEVAHEPVRSLTEFMDGADEIWMVDAFMDQPDAADRTS